MSIRVLDPTTGQEEMEARPAAGLSSLEGRTVGLLDNSKVNVRQFLDHVEEILRTQYGVREVVRRKKPDPSRPVPPNVLEDLTGSDAIISAVGD